MTRQPSAAEVERHATHGVDTADDYPNASHCPCVGIAAPNMQADCAMAGCRYCRVASSRINNGLFPWEKPRPWMLVDAVEVAELAERLRKEFRKNAIDGLEIAAWIRIARLVLREYEPRRPSRRTTQPKAKAKAKKKGRGR